MFFHFEDRISQVKKSLKDIDGFLVFDMSNVKYLTGFTGSSGSLLITKTKNIFLTDFRYKEQAETELKKFDIVIVKSNWPETLSKLVKKTGLKYLGIESSVSYAFFKDIERRIKLKPFNGVIEKIRAIKDDEEIRLLKEAVQRAESAFLETLPYIKKGRTEIHISKILEKNIKKTGSKHIPFDIIVASGKHSSEPHARPAVKKLEAGDLVVVDWGAEAGGYFSDMTRTLLVRGNNTEKKKEIYSLVLEANKKAISKIRPGIDCRTIDNSARNIIKKAGYDEYFGHGTGHGVGIQVHESPRISGLSKDVMRENMVFTIEPGIYLPGLGGVRIEDMVLCRAKPVLLTKLLRELKLV